MSLQQAEGWTRRRVLGGLTMAGIGGLLGGSNSVRPNASIGPAIPYFGRMVLSSIPGLAGVSAGWVPEATGRFAVAGLGGRSPASTRLSSLLVPDGIRCAVAIRVTFNLKRLLTAGGKVLPLLRAAVAVLVVPGTDQLALGVIEQPLVGLPIPVGIELAAGERASVSRGQENSAGGTLSSVSGGGDNTARREATSTNGGSGNTTEAIASSLECPIPPALSPPAPRV